MLNNSEAIKNKYFNEIINKKPIKLNNNLDIIIIIIKKIIMLENIKM